ncbi:MAG TPA: hypothetical protein VFJ82_12480 [Longimicrobium sp.]|nr:hypothetical protein [Longimicrobium sp.]
MSEQGRNPTRYPVAAYVREVDGPYRTARRQEVVVCNDGSVFWRSAGAAGPWELDDPIPGTPAAEGSDRG